MQRTPHLSKDTLISEIPSLTGIRGVAAVMVVAFHLQVMEPGAALRGPFQTFVSHGYLAVDLFFVLSGYVMALNYQGLFLTRWRTSDLRKFWLRRFARLYPMYFVGLAFAWRGSSRKPFISFPELFSNLAMVQNWGPWGSINSPSWSISTEAFAYLLFPFAVGPLLYGARRRADIATFIAMAGVLAAATPQLPGLFREPPSITQGPLSLVRCLCGFALGMMAYRTQSEPWAQSLRNSPWIAYFVCTVALIGLCLPVAALVVLPLLPLVVIALSGQRNIVTECLGWRPIGRLGLYSYSIYLLHQTLLYVLPWRMERWVRSVSGTNRPGVSLGLDAIVLVLLSALTYHCVEEPGRRLLRRLLETPPADQ